MAAAAGSTPSSRASVFSEFYRSEQQADEKTAELVKTHPHLFRACLSDLFEGILSADADALPEGAAPAAATETAQTNPAECPLCAACPDCRADAEAAIDTPTDSDDDNDWKELIARMTRNSPSERRRVNPAGVAAIETAMEAEQGALWDNSFEISPRCGAAASAARERRRSVSDLDVWGHDTAAGAGASRNRRVVIATVAIFRLPANYEAKFP